MDERRGRNRRGGFKTRPDQGGTVTSTFSQGERRLTQVPLFLLESGSRSPEAVPRLTASLLC
jgi:hypothetical protein